MSQYCTEDQFVFDDAQDDFGFADSISGPLPISMGGTGAESAAGAMQNLLTPLPVSDDLLAEGARVPYLEAGSPMAPQTRRAEDLAGDLWNMLPKDTEPTEGSENAVTSGATAAALSALQKEVQSQILDTYVTDTASGSIASFPDGADGVPVKALTVNVEPVQTGSGDPSPENVRPIRGFNSVQIFVTGKNIADGLTMESGYYNASGTPVSSSSLKRTPDYIPCQTGAQYCIAGKFTTANSRIRVHEYDADQTWLRQVSASDNIPAGAKKSAVWTASADAAYFRFSVPLYEDLLVGQVGTDATIQLGQTVYGGTLDVTSWVLTVDRANIASYNGETLPGKWISSMDVYAEGATPTTGAQVVYELAAPVTIDLSGIAEITTLYGDNCIWSDAGDVTVEYRADTALYLQQAIPEIDETFSDSDYGADYMETKSNLTYTKTGRTVSISGTRTNTVSVYTSITTDTPVAINSTVADPSFVNPNLALQAGRKYLARVEFLSGTLQNTGAAERTHSFFMCSYDGETAESERIGVITLASGETKSAADIPPEELLLTPQTDVQCGFVFRCSGLVVLDDFTVRVSIVDVTYIDPVIDDYKLDIVHANDEAITRVRAANWWWGDHTEKPTLFNLLHFSDIHGWADSLKRVVEMKEWLQDNGLLTAAICTGDIVKASYGGGQYESVWLANEGTKDILISIGNHDTYQTGTAPRGKLTPAEKYAAYFDGHVADLGITIDADTSYYYKDYTEQGVRLVVVDPAVTDSEADQKTWLDGVLLDAISKDYAVIVASHYLRLTSGTNVTSATIIDNNWSNSRARTMGTDTMTYDWAGTDIVKCVSDFVDAGGTFICYLIGHTHTDILGYPTGRPEQLIITVCTAALGEAIGASRVRTSNDLPRVEGTATQDAFNLLTIDTQNKLLKCVRIGSDINMLQVPRKAFVYDYATHTFINVV